MIELTSNEDLAKLQESILSKLNNQLQFKRFTLPEYDFHIWSKTIEEYRKYFTDSNKILEILTERLSERTFREFESFLDQHGIILEE